MAIIGGLEVPEQLIQLFRELVRPNDSRRYGSVAKNGHLLSKQQKLKVSTRSLLPQISELWKNLSPTELAAWKAAGNAANCNQWNLFVQDTAYRIKYGLPGLAIPSPLYQYKVGKLEIKPPANGALLKQYHPARYYKLKKVKGTKALSENVEIRELLVLPLKIELSYKSNLTAITDNARAKFYATIYSSYQGRTIETIAGFDLLQSTAWTRNSFTATDVIGKARSCDLNLDFSGVVGEFYWDNVVAMHSGTNYARDWRCVDVNNELTRSNYQIEKSWEEEFLPTGAAFDSVYHEE